MPTAKPSQDQLERLAHNLGRAVGQQGQGIRELLRETGVHAPSYYALVNAKAVGANLWTVAALAQHLGVSVDWLLGAKESEPTP